MSIPCAFSLWYNFAFIFVACFPPPSVFLKWNLAEYCSQHKINRIFRWMYHFICMRAMCFDYSKAALSSIAVGDFWLLFLFGCAFFPSPNSCGRIDKIRALQIKPHKIWFRITIEAMTDHLNLYGCTNGNHCNAVHSTEWVAWAGWR